MLLRVLQEYQTFAEQHPAVLESVGVSQESALTKARLLALLSLASRSHELSYAHIRVRAGRPCMHPSMWLRCRLCRWWKSLSLIRQKVSCTVGATVWKC